MRASKRTQEVQDAILDGGGDEHLKNLMFQKVFSWINSDVQLEQVRFHVNGAVRRNWMKTFKPVEFDQEIKLQDNPSPAKVEWLITFSRRSLLKLEERSIAKGLLDNLKKIQNDPTFFKTKHARHMGENTSVLFFLRANEIAAYERLGIGTFGPIARKGDLGPVGTVGPYGPLFKAEAVDSQIGNIYIYKKNIPALVTYLEDSLKVEGPTSH